MSDDDARASGGALGRLVRRSPAAAYLLPTYAIQIVLALFHHYQLHTFGAGYFRPMFPAFVALAVSALAFGKDSALKLLKSFTSYRHPLKYYAFALLYPTVVGFISLGILRLIGVNKHIELDTESIGTFEFFELNVQVALSEELAWVGFFVALWATRYRVFTSALIVGLFWGVWYIPLIIIQVQISPGFPIVPLVINFMSIAAICAWLYQRTNSALLVFLMQITTAYTGQIVPVLPLRGGVTQYVAFVICKCFFAVALFLIWGPKPLFGKVSHGN